MVSTAWCKFVHMRHELRRLAYPRYAYMGGLDMQWRDEAMHKAYMDIIEFESLNE